MSLDLFKEQGTALSGPSYFRVIYVLFFFDFLQKEHFKNEFDSPRPLEGRRTEIRKKTKKKKKVIVEHGTELWMTDSEDEGEGDSREKSIKKTHGNCFVSGELLDLTTGPKYSDGYLQHNLIHPSGEYSDVHAFALAHPHLYYSSITNHMNSKHFSELSRPVTAPEVTKRPSSPIVNNMPSQVSDQAKTGSTNSDLYPKWFRSAKLGETRPSTALLNLQNSWSKTEARRRFHEQFPEGAPDIRRKPDLRITTNERRHVIPETGIHVYYFHR